MFQVSTIRSLDDNYKLDNGIDNPDPKQSDDKSLPNFTERELQKTQKKKQGKGSQCAYTKLGLQNYNVKNNEFTMECGNDFQDGKSKSCCTTHNLISMNSVEHLSKKEFGHLKKKDKKLEYSKKKFDKEKLNTDFEKHWFNQNGKKNVKDLNSRKDIKINSHNIIKDILNNYGKKSGLNSRVKTIGNWLNSAYEIFNEKLPEIINQKLISIDKSKEASLVCQIIAYQYKSLNLDYIKKYWKIYKDNLVKCTEYNDNLRKNQYCKLCDNNYGKFFAKQKNSLYYKVSNNQCKEFTNHCSDNIFFFRKMMKFFYIIYKLVSCTKTGEDESSYSDKYLNWQENEQGSWIKQCNGVPVEVKYLKYIFMNGKPEDKEQYLKSNEKNIKDSQKYCNLVCESQMTSNGLTKIEYDNMQKMIELVREISYSTQNFSEKQNFKRNHDFNYQIVKERKLSDTFQARVDESLDPANEMHLQSDSISKSIANHAIWGVFDKQAVLELSTNLIKIMFSLVFSVSYQMHVLV